MSSIRALMRDIVANHPGDLNPLRLVQLTEQQHPDDWRQYETERALTGARTMASEVLRETLEIREEPLPGLDFGLPPRITLPDGEGGVTHRRFEDCNIAAGKDSDLRAHGEQILKPNIAAAQQAFDDFEDRRRACERAARRFKVKTGDELLKALAADLP